jgi:hypothetical protein
LLPGRSADLLPIVPAGIEMPAKEGKNRGRICLSRIKHTPAIPTPLTSLGRNIFLRFLGVRPPLARAGLI